MDRMLYVAMSGAKQVMEQQAAVANNMAPLQTEAVRVASRERPAIHWTSMGSSQAALTPHPPGTINVSISPPCAGSTAASTTRPADVRMRAEAATTATS
mgnify:CR=1 FL=1